MPERNGAANYDCYNALLAVYHRAGFKGYQPITIGYGRIDQRRNDIAKLFYERTFRDDDLLVMLDADHTHPSDIVERFAAHSPKQGVVGALAYRRGEPYDPLFFLRDKVKGGLFAPSDPTQFEGKTIPCQIVSTSAIAIRRWVLTELIRAGKEYPWFRYEYPTGGAQPSEDMYFGHICEQVGISHYCDTSIVIPHMTYMYVDAEIQAAYMAANPGIREAK